jgi:hypothetical protein
VRSSERYRALLNSLLLPDGRSYTECLRTMMGQVYRKNDAYTFGTARFDICWVHVPHGDMPVRSPSYLRS